MTGKVINLESEGGLDGWLVFVARSHSDWVLQKLWDTNLKPPLVPCSVL